MKSNDKGPLSTPIKVRELSPLSPSSNLIEPDMKFSLIFIATVLGSALATPVDLAPEAALEVRLFTS
jgi:hypothetical protein